MKRVLAGIVLALLLAVVLDLSREPSAQVSARGAMLLVRTYKQLVSPRISGLVRCRFQPTCSEYALQALGSYGMVRGGWLIARRLVRCSPLGHSPTNDYP